ncbi:MAG: glycosyltransferase family 4 protein [bacterium]|nr:glycosyltransferase family 4 protein [bacterium]
MAERGIDVIVVNFNKDVRIGGLAAKWTGSARVVWRVGVNLTKDSFVHRFLTPRLVDGVITPSYSLKKEITRLGYITDDMVRVIHTGIEEYALQIAPDLARKQLRSKYELPSDCPVAVTSGRFVDQKGHRHLVEAAPLIVKRFPQIRFLLLGEGPLEQRLKEQIDEAGLREHFVFAGLLDDFELELAGADIMLHPAVIEPFGIVLLEGMRAGMPVVACRVGGIPEVVAEGQTALLVEPGRSDDFAIATIALLGDRSQCTSFGEAARERWRKEFKYETMLDRVESYLTEIAGERAVRG